MASSVRILPHYIYSDYEQWDGRWELIDGIPHAMSPLPGPKHQRIAANLVAEFRFQLKKCATCAAYQPMDYKITEDTILQPDMLIVCGNITKKYLDFPPALVAEILSPGTFLKDRRTKYPIYETQGIRYYLIVSPETEEVELYEIESGAYKLMQKGRDFIHDFHFEDCNAAIDFKEIW